MKLDIKDMTNSLGSIAPKKSGSALYGGARGDVSPQPISNLVQQVNAITESANDVSYLKDKANQKSLKVKDGDTFKNVTVPMTLEMKYMIDDINLKIERNKKAKNDKLTTNSVIRCFLCFLDELDLDVSNVNSEATLKDAMRKAMEGHSWKS
jgi:hypothetical protein